MATNKQMPNIDKNTFLHLLSIVQRYLYEFDLKCGCRVLFCFTLFITFLENPVGVLHNITWHNTTQELSTVPH